MPAIIHHLDLYGKRGEKYTTLESLSLADATFTEIIPTAPYYFFIPKNTDGQVEYESGFSVGAIFGVNVTGIQTGNDDILTAGSKNELHDRLKNIAGFDIDQKVIKRLSYRPFDNKYCYYIEGLSKNPYENIKIPSSYRPRFEVMKNFFQNNLGLVIGRQGQVVGGDEWNLIYCVNTISDLNIFYRGGGVTFPLYLYSDSPTLEGTTKTPNLDATIWAKINESIGRETTPEEVLDYIYAVLHSPSYREKYREFLKIDFPRVPYPTSREVFDSLVRLGGELRGLHLLESPRVEEYITTFPLAGSGIVEKVSYVDGRVYINGDQYFGEVPSVAWDFSIGGYQPAQKWLKDRKGRTLSWEDIAHYQSMIVALTETSRVMGEIEGFLQKDL